MKVCRFITNLLLTTVWLSAGMAAAVDQESKLGASTKTADNDSRLSTTVTVSHTRSTLDPHDELATSYQSMDILLSYPLPYDLTVSAYANVDQENDVDRETQVGNAYLGVGGTLVKFNEQVSLVGTVRGYAPTNAEDRSYKSYRGSAFASPGLKVNLDPIVPGLAISAGSAYKHDFYEYEDNRENNYNLERIWTNSLVASYSWQRLSLSLTWANSASWNTDNQRNDDSYQMAQEIAVQAMENLSLAIGHQNADRTFGYDGLSNNMRMFDVNSSQVYGSAAYTF